MRYRFRYNSVQLDAAYDLIERMLHIFILGSELQRHDEFPVFRRRSDTATDVKFNGYRRDRFVTSWRADGACVLVHLEAWIATQTLTPCYTTDVDNMCVAMDCRDVSPFQRTIFAE